MKEKREMKTEVITLTKELAMEFLGENNLNRPPKRGAIQRYINDMIAGRWQLNGEAIKFDTEGRLIDGQNRCFALIAACEIANRDVTIETLVIRGVERSAQDSMDGGARRTVGDQLAMRGHAKYAKLAAALRTVALWDDDKILVQSFNLPRMRLIELYESDESNFRRLNDEEIDSLNTSCINASTRVAAKYVLLYRVGANSSAVEEFFYKLGTGSDLTSDSPILALRNRQFNMKVKGIRQRNNLTFILILRAWNAWRKGESMKKIMDRNPQGEIIIPKEIAS